MKVLNYSSINFWNELDNHLSLREIETSSKIETDVKSIIADIKKYGDDKIIQYDPTMFSFMIPSTYKEVLIRVYCKNMTNYETIKMHYNKMLDIYNGKYKFQ